MRVSRNPIQRGVDQPNCAQPSGQGGIGAAAVVAGAVLYAEAIKNGLPNRLRHRIGRTLPNSDAAAAEFSGGQAAP